MGEYQVRSWEGFHKHITLSFLSFYYVAYQKLKYEENLPLPIRPEGPRDSFPKGIPSGWGGFSEGPYRKASLWDGTPWESPLGPGKGIPLG